jgi:ApaG protein
MSAPQPQPISEAISNGFRVEVMSRHSAENSQPGQWVFEYTVRVTNVGQETAQLMSRHWVITDAMDEITEVRGPGVVGEQPVLAPGQAFQYSSWCPLKTPTGTMHGSYQMKAQDGKIFDIEIPWFALRSPFSVH